VNHATSTVRQNVRTNVRTAVIMLLIAGGVWLLAMIAFMLVWVLSVPNPNPNPPEPLPWRTVEHQDPAPVQGAQLHLDTR
jgi:hypothetical protein